MSRIAEIFIMIPGGILSLMAAPFLILMMLPMILITIIMGICYKLIYRQ